MAIWESDLGRDVLKKYDAHTISLPIFYISEPYKTKMFSGMGADADLLTTEAMLLNSHTWGVDPEFFETYAKLKNIFNVTSISYEPKRKKRAFTATMESEKYPFFGTQFHPEKVAFMFNNDSGVNHTWKSL